MTKDYAKPSTTRKAANNKKGKPGASRKSAPPPEKPKKGKLIFILVLLVGILAYGIYFLQSLPESNSAKKEIEQKSESKPSQIAAKDKESEEKPDQRFKFYDLLPETEVIPPKVDAYQFKEKNSDKTVYYVLQTGSFRSRTDAERQKAQIAFQGLKAEIKAVTADSGSIWYRVSVGPYYSRSPMNASIDKLVSMNIKPLVKKFKSEN